MKDLDEKNQECLDGWYLWVQFDADPKENTDLKIWMRLNDIKEDCWALAEVCTLLNAYTY